MMPSELAMPILISSKDLRGRTQRGGGTAPALPRPPPCFHSPLGGSRRERGRAGKRVSFADHKGLALAAVKVFSGSDEPLPPLPVSAPSGPFPRRGPSPGPAPSRAPDFAQPSADYARFRERVERDFVCLEQCVLRGCAAAGTVKVKNVSYEKAVALRVSFDSWRSHADVGCRYVPDACSSADWDTFSFELDLPRPAAPPRNVEFAVFYVVNGNTYWDSNHGQNYKLAPSALETQSGTGTFTERSPEQNVLLDRYGGPRCLGGFCPEWPSYAGYEDLGPYY